MSNVIIIRLPPNGIPGPDQRLSKLTPSPCKSNTSAYKKIQTFFYRIFLFSWKYYFPLIQTLSIAKATPVGLRRETNQNGTELESFTKTWIKYIKLIIVTAKLPSTPAV